MHPFRSVGQTESPWTTRGPIPCRWSPPRPVLVTRLLIIGLLSLSCFTARADSSDDWKRRKPSADNRLSFRRLPAIPARTPSVRRVAAEFATPDRSDTPPADNGLAAGRTSDVRPGSSAADTAPNHTDPQDLTDPPAPAPETTAAKNREDSPGPEDWMLEARQREKQLRYQKLTEQLRSMIDAWNAAQTEPENTAAGNSGTGPVVPADTDPSLSQPKENNPADGGTSQTPAGAPEGEGESDKSQVASISDPVNGPIDRLALANNLYAIREFVLSLELYEQIDQTSLSPEDRFWIEYQIAGCLRRLKRTADAQQRYRRLAGQPDAGWLHELSRWWLERMVMRNELENEMRQFDTVIAKLRENQNVSAAR